MKKSRLLGAVCAGVFMYSLGMVSTANAATISVYFSGVLENTAQRADSANIFEAGEVFTGSFEYEINTMSDCCSSTAITNFTFNVNGYTFNQEYATSPWGINNNIYRTYDLDDDLIDDLAEIYDYSSINMRTIGTNSFVNDVRPQLFFRDFLQADLVNGSLTPEDQLEFDQFQGAINDSDPASVIANWQNFSGTRNLTDNLTYDNGFELRFNLSSGDGAASVAGSFTTFQITQVPLPAAVWLFGSGLLGLFGIARRRKTT